MTRAVQIAELGDQNTFTIDGDNNRVGIASSSPGTKLDVNGTIRMSAVPGANTNADLKVLFQTSTGTIDGGSGLTYNPGGDNLSVNGNFINLNTFRGAGSQATFTSANGAGQYDFRAHNDSLRFIAGSSEKLRIDSSGRLMIGASSAFDSGSSTLLQVLSTGGARIALARNDTTTAANDSIGRIRWYGNDSDGNYDECARIDVIADADHASNSKPSALTFHTTASSAESSTERLRIDSSGFVGIGEASPQLNGGGQLTVKRSSTATTGLNGVLRLKQGSATNGNRASLVFSSLDNFNVAAVNSVIETHAGSESNNVGRLEFYTKASGSSIAERLRIDSSGNVLINTTTLPTSDSKLTVQNSGSHCEVNVISGASSGSVVNMGDTDDYNDGRIKYDNSTRSMQFQTANAEQMRIDSSGRVGINTSAPSRTLVVAGSDPIIRSEDTDTGDTYAEFKQLAGSLFIDSRNGSSDGTIIFRGVGGGSATEKLRIDSAGNMGLGASSPGAKLDVNGNVLLSQANPKITFNTGGANIHAPAANTLAFNTDGSNERVRIHNLGRVLFGRAISADPWLASGNVDAGQYFGSGNNFGAAINSRDIPLILNRTNTTGSIQEFKYNGSTTGFISTTSSAITISYSSDYRLKENVIPLADAITRVKQLQPKRFNYIIDPGVTVDGFIAHEAQTVVPEAVVGTHNQVDDNGDPVYQGIDPSKMIPLLTAALQEAIAKIETLETQNSSLEARLTALEG